jgi:broad specificity phosphatase PhoE
MNDEQNGGWHMRVVVIRHGERDDTPCYERGFIGQGLELAPLTENGVKQAECAATNDLIRGAQIIVSSPYTRCMQTAAIISRIRNIPMTVEVDLHEWIPDLTFQNRAGEGKLYGNDFTINKGKYPDGETRKWESIGMMENRLIRVLEKYIHYDKIILVTHGMLMHQIKPYGHIPNCFVDEFTYDENFKCAGFHELL